MIYKYLFFIIAKLNKKIDLFGGTDEYCYYAASALVGVTIAINAYVVVDIVSILFIHSKFLFEAISTTMDIFCLVMALLSFIYFKHNGRWNKLYEEILQLSYQQRVRNGICCLLYVLLVYGLWFFCNEIIRVLNTGKGLPIAESVVNSIV